MFLPNQICQNDVKTGAALFTVANQDEQIYKEASSGKYYVQYAGPTNR